jgi:hypothetical protein
MDSAPLELHKDDMEDFAEYLLIFNTRLQVVERIEVKPDSESIKMFISKPCPSIAKPTQDTMALNLQIIYDLDASDLTRMSPGGEDF